jgi:hypothetical protein
MCDELVTEASESAPGRPLLVPFVRSGQILRRETLSAMQTRTLSELRALPPELRQPEHVSREAYSVRYSRRFLQLAPTPILRLKLRPQRTRSAGPADPLASSFGDLIRHGLLLGACGSRSGHPAVRHLTFQYMTPDVALDRLAVASAEVRPAQPHPNGDPVAEPHTRGALSGRGRAGPCDNTVGCQRRERRSPYHPTAAHESQRGERRERGLDRPGHRVRAGDPADRQLTGRDAESRCGSRTRP